MVLGQLIRKPGREFMHGWPHRTWMLFRKETSRFVQKNVKGSCQSDPLYPATVSRCLSRSLCLHCFFLATDTWETDGHRFGTSHLLNCLTFMWGSVLLLTRHHVLFLKSSDFLQKHDVCQTFLSHVSFFLTVLETLNFYNNVFSVNTFSNNKHVNAPFINIWKPFFLHKHLNGHIWLSKILF